MTRTIHCKLLTPLFVAGQVVAMSAATGCKKEEPPPPLPSAAPAADTAPLELKPIDAGIKEEDAGKKKPTGKGYSSGGLLACCNALEQNSHSQPTEQMKNNMQQAAAVCKAAAKMGNSAAVTGALAQFGMSCK